MNVRKRKSRIGIGYIGKIFMYATGVGPNGCSTRRNPDEMPGRAKRVKKLNKNSAMRRAAKKAERRHDAQFAKDE